jgi:hypothetical protein
MRYYGVLHEFQQIQEKLCLMMTKKLTKWFINGSENMHYIQVKNDLHDSISRIDY